LKLEKTPELHAILSTQIETILNPEAVLVSRADLSGKITFANQSFQTISGYTQAELIEQPHNIIRHPCVPSKVFKDFWHTIQKGKVWKGVLLNRTKSGGYYWVEAHVSPYYESGKVVGYESVRYPCSDEQKQQAIEAYIKLKSDDYWLHAGQLYSKNYYLAVKYFPYLMKLYPWVLGAVIALMLSMFLVSKEVNYDWLEASLLGIALFVLTWTIPQYVVLKKMVRHLNDLTQGVISHTQPFFFFGITRKLGHRISSLQNQFVSEHLELKYHLKELEDKEKSLTQLAYFDPLTKLPNRGAFQARLEQMVKLSKRHHRRFALYFIDLDNFKTINDSYGHQYGDLVLVEVSKRLKSVLREDDSIVRVEMSQVEGVKDPHPDILCLSRLGGDEFTVIAEIEQVEDAALVAQRLVEVLGQPYIEEDQVFHSSPSIGIAVYPDDAQSCEVLLQHADAAMYHAKEQGKGNYQYFDARLHETVQQKKWLEKALRQALSLNQFYLDYQPQVIKETGQICGVEALIRWKHPEKGLIPPAHFIPIAEEINLISEIGRWVFRTVCLQIRDWHRQQVDIRRIGINVSLKEFHDPAFLTFIKSTLTETGVDAGCIELEVIESTLMDNPEEAILILTKLKEMGFKLSIDDFGTGYSSMSHLKMMPVDRIKIDKIFADDLLNDQRNQAIINAIVSMAETLSMETILEGVESEGQVDLLAKMKLNEIQGYYYSKPVSPDEIKALFK